MKLSTNALRPYNRVARIFEEATGQDLTSKERYEFLPSVKDKAVLSPAQERWLTSIERRVFNTIEEDDD